MGTRQSEIITISVPPVIAKTYRMMARARGESASALFREMFERFRKENLTEAFDGLQSYGEKKAGEAGITEKDVERLVFGDR
jgi:hypothetical protein